MDIKIEFLKNMIFYNIIIITFHILYSHKKTNKNYYYLFNNLLEFSINLYDINFFLIYYSIILDNIYLKHILKILINLVQIFIKYIF